MVQLNTPSIFGAWQQGENAAFQQKQRQLQLLAFEQERQAQQAAAQREAAIRQAIASGVDPSSREGLGQLLQAGLPLEQFQSGLKSIGDIELAKARGEAAQRTAGAAETRAKAAERAAKARERQVLGQLRINAAQLGISQQNADANYMRLRAAYDKTRAEALGQQAYNLQQLSPEQRKPAYQIWRQQKIANREFKESDLPTDYDELIVTSIALGYANKNKGPLSAVAKIEEDFRQGRLSQQQRDAAIAKETTTVSGEGSFNETQKLRKEYLDRSKEFIDIRNSYSALQAVSANPSAAGDISIVFSFMKMLDPISVVREGEQATVRNAAGIPDKIRNIYNKALTGEGLTPDQRQDILNQAKNLYDKASEQQERNSKTYINISEKSGLDPNLVVPDITLAQPTPSGGGQGGNRVMSFEEFMSQ